MIKKVLIISGSPRKGGNSDILCDEFAKGAKEAGHQVEKVRLQELTVKSCMACYACKKTSACVQKDDMTELLEKLISADVLVLATRQRVYNAHCFQVATQPFAKPVPYDL